MSEERTQNRLLKNKEYFENEFVILDSNGEVIYEFTENNSDDEITCVSEETLENDTQLLQFEFDTEDEDSNRSFKELKSVNNSQQFLLGDDSENFKSDTKLTDAEDRHDSYDVCDVNFKVPLEEYKMKKHNSKLFEKDSKDLKKFSHKQNKKYTYNKKDQAMAELCKNKFVDILFDNMLSITNIIDYGKESIIFHANSNPTFARPLPKECAVRIPKSILSQFKQWEKYMKGDDYFKDKFNKHLTNETLQRKAEKEKVLLMMLRKANVKCPKVVALNNGVLVTTFIGKNKKVAPTLNDAVLTKDESWQAYHQVVYYVHMMYRANIVHGALTEHNILWHNNMCYVINIGRGVDRSHPEAFNFIFRDCSILNFFANKYDINMCPQDFFFTCVVGHDFNDKEALEKLRESFQSKIIE